MAYKELGVNMPELVRKTGAGHSRARETEEGKKDGKEKYHMYLFRHFLLYLECFPKASENSLRTSGINPKADVSHEKDRHVGI